MALSRFHLPLALILIMPLPVLLSAASHHHEQPASSAGHRPRHRYQTASATTHFHPAPSMHQNHHLEVEESKSLLGVEPFAAMGQASSAEEAVAAMAAAADHPTLLVPPPQADQPSPPVDPFTSAPDLASQGPPQPQAEEAAAPPPPLDEPTAAVMTFPLPDERTTAASPPPPVRAGAAGEVASGDDQRVVQLARVLTSLGYSEMASAAPLLVGSPDLARWTGAITIFAAPDISFRLLCPTCSRRRHLLEHIGLGYFSYSELAAVPAAKIPSASRGFCLSVASERGPYATHYARLFVDGVEVSYPELYNDGLYVVHGLHRALRPLSRASCSDGSHHHNHHHHHLTTRSAATSASVVRIMILEAIARLRDGGYGFVALAMRVKFAELEKFANLTVFALDDPAIFAGGGQDYVSAVRFHVVPGYRLTLADLLRLPAGTMLPTMAGEGQNLVITHGADSRSDDVIINYIPIKQPDVVVNSRIAVHGVYVPFPRLYLANLAASVAVASAIDMNGTCGGGGPFGGCASTATTSATTPGAHGYGEGQ